MKKEAINEIVKYFVDEPTKLIRETQESPDRFFYLLKVKNKKYLLIKNDYFDLPRYEEMLFNVINVKLAKWILPKGTKETISLLDGNKFVNIDKYFISYKDAYWKYALAEVKQVYSKKLENDTSKKDNRKCYV